MNSLGLIWQDLRYAVRSLRKDRGSVALALLALALGIGASAVVFSVVYSVLINPFPYTNSRRLVYVYIHDVKDSGPYGRSGRTPKEFFNLKQQNHVFSDVMSASSMNMVYTVGNSTYQATGAAMDPLTFSGLGFKPELGRAITQSDGAPGAPPVFVISDRLWHERFNRDPSVLGQSITVNGTPRTLVAVLPPRFLLFRGDIFYPLTLTPDTTRATFGQPNNFPLYVWTAAVLKPDVSLTQAAAECNVIAHNDAKLYPDLFPKQFTVKVGTIIDSTTASMQTMIYILLGAVLMLLLIACANVANLLLSRATAREKELAVRATLGATRGRLVRQLLAESFVLALGGAALGCFLAYAGLHAVNAMMPPNTVPEEIDIHLSLVALAATLAITAVTTLLCGTAPAFHAARGNLHTRLMGTGKGVGVSTGHGRLRSVLVVAQVGLSIVLLVGAGLMMRTFFALGSVDVGINPKSILATNIVFPSGQYTTTASKSAFLRQLLPRVAALPGVISVTESITVPVEGGANTDITVPGTTHSDTWSTNVELITEDYFQTVGLPVLRGRILSANDVDSMQKVIVVNRKFVHNFFGDSDAIGRTVKFNVLDRIPDAPHDAYFQIVGVVGDALNNGLQKDVAPEAFMPYTVTALAGNELLLKTAVSPTSVVPSLRQQVASIDQNIALSNTDSLETILHRDYFAAPEFGLVLLSIFAGIGLVLSAIGVFSVMAYTVSLQTHDIGIRMALGAQPQGVLKMVLLKGLLPIGIGVVLGLLASYASTRVLASQIYGVKATDPWTYSGVVVVLAIVGLLACLLPARRATQVDPLIALRYE
jgi:putative ABC transport system permease protein